MLKIWGRTNSINVQKVLWCADELGLAYERTDAGGAFGVVNTPEYQRMNPNAKVPAIDDDGFILWESNAIVRYLSAKHGAGSLWPEGVQARADVDRWMDWQTTAFTPALVPAFFALVRKSKDYDAAAVEASRRNAEAMARMLDAALAGRDFIGGAAFTMGDIPVGLATHRWYGMPFERPALPNLEAWYARLKARPGAAQVMATPVS